METVSKYQMEENEKHLNSLRQEYSLNPSENLEKMIKIWESFMKKMEVVNV